MLTKEIVLEFDSKRSKVEKLKEELKTQKEIFEKTITGIKYEIQEAEKELESTKNILEEQALAEYAETKEKNLIGGFKIQDRKYLEYDATEAFNWAKEKGMFLLMDIKQFEKSVPALNLDFVKQKTKEQVTYPKDIKLEE